MSTPKTLRIDVPGGGPVGLAFALVVKHYLSTRVHVRVFERRWSSEDQMVRWQGAAEGNVRRGQVVTLQSNVWSMLPDRLRHHLFLGDYQEMWPHGPDSPADVGPPRNIRIRTVEDRLLELAQSEYDIELLPEAYVADRSALRGLDVLAICDGPHSRTREHYIDAFGAGDPKLYGLEPGRPLTETILGLHVHSNLTAAETVILTVANNRFLLNSLHGDGFLNMRLSPEEAREIKGIGTRGLTPCTQSNPCVLRAQQGAWFWPAFDPSSKLWPRIREGLDLFGATKEGLLSATAFKLGTPVHRPRFTVELTPGTYGFLLGDAANALHFWPGRGLNCGLKGAISLARSLARQWDGTAFRDADFTGHEGIMQMLQYRNKSRARRTVAMADRHGRPRPIQERIRAGLDGPYFPQHDQRIMLERIRGIRSRLESRMAGPMPSDENVLARLGRLSPSTLKVLVETGAWVTAEVRGQEVAVPE